MTVYVLDICRTEPESVRLEDSAVSGVLLYNNRGDYQLIIRENTNAPFRPSWLVCALRSALCRAHNQARETGLAVNRP